MKNNYIDSDDVLNIYPQDLTSPSNKKECKGTTIKGEKCKNKVYQDKEYCKKHFQKFKFEKPKECPVCMESLDNENLPLSCCHWVHKKCIIEWGERKCPVCRSEIKLTLMEERKIRKKKNRINNNRGINRDEVNPRFLNLFEYVMNDRGILLSFDVMSNSLILIGEFD